MRENGNEARDFSMFFGTLITKDGRIHDNVKFYSADGYFIPASLYHDQLEKRRQQADVIKVKFDEKAATKEIMSTWGIRYIDMKKRQDEQIQREKETYPKIHNLRELVAYVRTLLSPQELRDTETNLKKCKNRQDPEEMIRCFPSKYHFPLRYRLAKDRKERYAIEKDTESIIRNAGEKPVTNPLLEES